MIARSDRPQARSALRFPLAVFALSLTVVLSLFAGCGLSTGGIPGLDGGAPCTTAAQCDDDNPCTVDACGASGTCTHTGVADGQAPASVQISGDCHVINCVAGEPATAVDDSDKPNSHNPCVVDECSMGMALQDETANNGHPCQTMGLAGSCGGGKCGIVCTKADDCVPMPPNPCVTPSCNGATATCDFPPLMDGTPTPGVIQTTGDCHQRICLTGKDTDAEDASDVPAVMGDCQDPTCKAGVPTQAPHGSDSPCSTYMGNQPGFCDGAGHCAQCAADGECPGSTTDCQRPSCTGNVCGTTFTTPGTPTSGNPAQVLGDCQKIVCDVGGATKSIADNIDLPDDSNICTHDLCTAGVPSHTPNPGVMCGGTMAMPELCSAQGMCGCMTGADCTLPNTCGGGNPGTPGYCGCTKTTCTAKSTTCGSISDGCFAQLMCNTGTKDGTETDVDCGGIAAPGSTCAVPCVQGKKCGAGTDCASGLFCVDGVCCNNSCTGKCQACSAAKKGQGVDGVCQAIKLGQDPENECPAAAVSTCDDVGGCNGAGACSLWPNGSVCQAATCMNATTILKADTCDGVGACNAPMMPTQDCSPNLCSSGACTTTCNVDTDCAPTAFCNTGMHKCTAKLGTGGACMGANQCSNGLCVDGFCCGTACNTGACVACSMALTGAANGTCAAVTVGTTDPRNVCQQAQTSPTMCGNDGKCAAGSACEKWSSATICANPTCSTVMNQQTAVSKCNGTGTCVAGATTPCSPLICGATACLTGCAGNDANCIPGDYCDSGGMCQTKIGLGNTCTAGHQCGTGICGTGGTGRCCAATCTTGGTCGATGCAPTTGACVYPAALTNCQMGTCTTDSLGSLKVCDGAGTCATVPTHTCPAGMCAASGCSSCATDADCTSFGYCGSGSMCTAKGQHGVACTDDSQCLSGNCVGNTTCT